MTDPTPEVLQWQEQVNLIQEQVTQLALQLQTTQTQLTTALAEQSNNPKAPEITALKTEIAELRQSLQAAQTTLSETRQLMEAIPRPSAEGDPPAQPANPAQPSSRRKKVWL